LRFFVFVKAKPGRETEVAVKMKSLPNVNRVYLIPREFDLLAEVHYDDASFVNHKTKISETILNGIRSLGHVVYTRTIIPIEPTLEKSSNESTGAFALIQTQPGRANEVLRRLKELLEVKAAHLMFGEADLFLQLQVNITSAPQPMIASIIQNEIMSVRWISDTDTVIPFLEFNCSPQSAQLGLPAN
jgi:DNA-binding Lrp family transcriptional regulator